MTAWRLFWLSLALMLAGMVLMFFWSMPMIEAGGQEPFDLRAGGYTHDEAVAFLSALTEGGRAAYLGPQRLADTLFPLGLAGVLVLGTWLAWRRSSRAVALAAALPALIYVCFDMLENAAVAGMLRAGPVAVTAGQVARASAFTQWKMIFFDTAVAVLAIGMVVQVVRWGTRKETV